MFFTRPFLLCVLGFASIGFAQTAGVESPQGDLIRVSNGAFYGTSNTGGVNNQGAIFRVTPESEVSVAVNFTGDAGTVLGAAPRAGLVDDGTGVLWGLTVQGGTSGLGTVFKFVPSTGALTTVVEFDGTNGSLPLGALESDGAGLLWGTTRTGGANDLGTVFTVDTSTGTLTTVVSFTGTTGAAIGAEPKAKLARDANGLWWGTTATGGTGGLGTIFSIDPGNSNAFTSEVIFTGTNGANLGSYPEAGLTIDGDGEIWGTTTSGGTTDKGTVFRFDPATDTFTTLVNFAGTNGSNPKAVLREDSGFMWGTTFSGGASDEGTIFTVATADDAHSVVASFSGTGGTVHGAYPLAGLVPGAAGELWGVTSQGGLDDRGTIYKVFTATKTFQLVAEPEIAPVAPTATVQKPPVTATNVPLGTPVTLRGTAKDNFQLVSVVVSINGGPFFPATLTAPVIAGKPFTWEIDVLPENGLNVVIIKSVDNGGNPAKPVKLTFNYTITRPDLAGSYTGVITPDPLLSTTPLLHSGVFNFKVTPTGRFTGKVTLGGRPTAVVLTGSIGNGGAARFGKTGLELLTIPRKNQIPLTLSLHLDPVGLSRTVTGCLHENGVMLGIVDGGQMLYTSKLNPVAPLKNVPTTLLNPATDKGSYTVLLRALTPIAQGRPADEYPQGDGYATFKVKSNGSIKIVGKLSDGSSFMASNSLMLDTFLPVFTKLYIGTGALVGKVEFRDEPQSDADCAGMLWFRPANAKATNYRNGWPTGIQTDFFASRFVAPVVGGGVTALGHPASAGVANALATLVDGNLPGQLDNLLAIPEGGIATILAAPGGGTAPVGLKFSLLKTGIISGSFTHPASTTATAIAGAVLQKAQVGGGYFLAAPVGGVATDPKQSGRVQLVTQ